GRIRKNREYYVHLIVSKTNNDRMGSVDILRFVKLWPSRCASTIQIVRPSTSTAETHPKLQPALLRLSAMISKLFTHCGFTAAFPHRVFGKPDRSATDRRPGRR